MTIPTPQNDLLTAIRTGFGDVKTLLQSMIDDANALKDEVSGNAAKLHAELLASNLGAVLESVHAAHAQGGLSVLAVYGATDGGAVVNGGGGGRR